MSSKSWSPPQTQAERDADRIADLMASRDYSRNRDAQAEVRAAFQRYYGQPRPAAPPPPPGVTDASLRAAMRDPRYADGARRDPAFVQQVQAGWKQLYPDPMPGSHTGRPYE